jgi:two-component system cell cycle response regulator
LAVVADPEHRDSLDSLLASEGHDVLCLCDADEVMRVVAEFEPDLVLLEMELPFGSSLELCGELKASDPRQPFPVMLVGHDAYDEGVVAAGLLAGADDFVFAHERQLELKARIRVQLRNKRHLDAMTRLRGERDSLKRDAEIDPLTGVLNRRALVRIVSKGCDSNRRFGALFIDVDHFKTINDRFGHDVGDRVLVRLAELLKACLRPGDSVGRYGGEEFVAVVAGAGVESLRLVAERLRSTVAATVLDEPLSLGVTVSVGGALFDARRGENTDALLRRADLAVYEAKRTGRNKVVIDVVPRVEPPATATTGSVVALEAVRRSPSE